jgi:hypothetical protein
MTDPGTSRNALLAASPLLITESKEEFEQLRDAFNQEIKPRGIVEQMYVADIIILTWEIVRLRRCKAGNVNLTFGTALKKVLGQLLRKPMGTVPQVEADRLAHRWFSDPQAKKQVSELLRHFQLDESAIEAEAIKSLGADLDRFDRLLASSESRRNKALRCIADCRGGFATILRESSDRIIDGQVLALENASSKNPSAAA